MTQDQIKSVGGKDQKPDYEEKNGKTLVDAHDNHLDMNGNTKNTKYEDLLKKVVDDKSKSEQKEAKPDAAKEEATPTAKPDADKDAATPVAKPELSLI
jgi:hypothetical protein